MMTVINQFALLSNQQNSVPKFYWLSAYFFSSIFLSYAKSIVMKSFKRLDVVTCRQILQSISARRELSSKN